MSLPEALVIVRQVQAKEKRCDTAERGKLVNEAMERVIEAAERPESIK